MIFRITERIVQQPPAFVNLEIFGARVYGSSVNGDQCIGPPLFGRPQHDGRIAGRARRGALQVSKLIGYGDLVEAFAFRIELIEPFGSRQPQFTLAVSPGTDRADPRRRRAAEAIREASGRELPPSVRRHRH